MEAQYTVCGTVRSQCWVNSKSICGTVHRMWGQHGVYFESTVTAWSPIWVYGAQQGSMGVNLVSRNEWQNPEMSGKITPSILAQYARHYNHSLQPFIYRLWDSICFNLLQSASIRFKWTTICIQKWVTKWRNEWLKNGTMRRLISSVAVYYFFIPPWNIC